MTYYFVSLNPSTMKTFVRNLSFGKEGEWVSDKAELEKALETADDQTVFFIHLSGKREVLDDFCLTIRDQGDAKVIYVTEEGTSTDLRNHQSTPAGGDAYVGISADGVVVKNVLRDLWPSRPITSNENKVDLGFTSEEELKKVADNPLSQEMDDVFKNIERKQNRDKDMKNAIAKPVLSTQDQELALDEISELEIDLSPEVQAETPEDDGLDLSLSDDEEVLDLADEQGEESFSLGEDEGILENLGEIDFGNVPDYTPPENESPKVSSEESPSADLSLDSGLDLPGDELLSLDADSSEENELSEDAREKLKEIDAIMENPASQININVGLDIRSLDPAADSGIDSSLDEPLVSEDLNLDSLNFSSEAEPTEVVKKKKDKEEPKEPNRASRKEANENAADLRAIAGAYNGEMERTQATLANLRADREELLRKIQQLEDDRLMQNRTVLTMRAELDEKKIELTIIRKKLNEEISELKDKIRVSDERKLILEERNRLLQQELEKVSQKTKIDMKKVQLRERELEQRLELLKADSETQIRHRDLKILELKRKIDAMEFDMESISMQEKRSVESRFELEDKLDKAIKTLRSAITVLESDTDKSNVLDALKKNIDM